MQIQLGPMSSVKTVREELVQISGREEWNQKDYWNFFLHGRRTLFDSAYDAIEDKNWLNPTTAKRANAHFVERAKEYWGRPGDEWVLQGGWMTDRQDILSWMRASYWKHSKPKRDANKRGRGNEQESGDRSMGGRSMNTDTATPISSQNLSWGDVVGISSPQK